MKSKRVFSSKIKETPEELALMQTTLVGHEPILLLSYIHDKEKGSTMLKVWGTAMDAKSGLAKIKALQEGGMTQFDVLLGDTRRWLKFPVDAKSLKEKHGCALDEQKMISNYINDQNSKMKQLKKRMQIFDGANSEEDNFMAMVRHEAAKILRTENYSETHLREKFRRFKENMPQVKDKEKEAKTQKVLHDIFSSAE